VLFALAGFLAYFKRRYYLSAIAFGLCVLSKESGIFFILALGLYHLWANAERARSRSSPLGLKKMLVFLVVIAFVVGIPLWAYDYAYHPYSSTSVLVEPTVIVNPASNATSTTTATSTVHSGPVTDPLENFLFYYTYQSSLTGCGTVNAWNCFPWSWILPFNVGPLSYYVNTVTSTVTSTTCSTPQTCSPTTVVTTLHPIDWRGIGNLVVWYSIWLVVPITAWKLIKRQAGELDALVFCLIEGTYLPIFYISLVSNRVEYAFYFINTDVGLALGIPLVLAYLARGSVKAERLLLALWIVAVVAFFFYYFPVNPFAFRS